MCEMRLVGREHSSLKPCWCTSQRFKARLTSENRVQFSPDFYDWLHILLHLQAFLQRHHRLGHDNFSVFQHYCPGMYCAFTCVQWCCHHIFTKINIFNTSKSTDRDCCASAHQIIGKLPTKTISRKYIITNKRLLSCAKELMQNVTL